MNSLFGVDTRFWRIKSHNRCICEHCGELIALNVNHQWVHMHDRRAMCGGPDEWGIAAPVPLGAGLILEEESV